MTYFKSDFVVDVEYLISARNREDVVVLDSRGDMLEENSNMYDKAIVVDWTDISLLGEFGGEDLGKLLSKETYLKIFDKLNISENTEVIVYGFTMPKEGFGDEGRVIYTFNFAGYKNIKMVDGGYKYIEKYGFNKKYCKATDRISVLDIDKKEALSNKEAIYTEELLSILKDENIQIIDTRLSLEYNGRVIYGENKAGHIPKAISLPFNSLVSENGFLKSKENIINYLESIGIDKNKVLITYCTTGVRASYVAVILKELGYTVRNYEPSFAHYANVGEVEI